MSALDLSVTGADELVARLAQLPATLRAGLVPVFSGIADTLYARVMEKLDGEVVKARSGKLRSAIAPVSDDLSANVSLDPGIAPYGSALEFGASIPAQLIAAKNAKALAFVVGGRQVFATHVMHPAIVLPPHSFLRSALDELGPDMTAQVAAGVDAAVNP